MYYNLVIKKQRRNFWLDCEKAIVSSNEYNEDTHSWGEHGRYMSPSQVFTFWYENNVLWDNKNKFENFLSKNAIDTFDHYEVNDVEDFDEED